MQCIGSREKYFSVSYTLHYKKKGSEIMKYPKTFTGYDKDGKIITSCTAENANNYINPDEVKTAVNNLNTTIDTEITTITSELNNLKSDVEVGIIVQGTNMTENVETLSSAIDDVAEAAKEAAESVHSSSIKAHDQIQQELNQSAKNTVNSYPGVVSVSGSLND